MAPKYKKIFGGECSHHAGINPCKWYLGDNINTFNVTFFETNTSRTRLQYIPRNMHTVFALLCFVVVIHWLIFPYPSGLLHWHCGNLTIAPVPAKQPWWIWINTSCEFIMNDCITTTKQSTTKPCAYFLGYTVYRERSTFQSKQYPNHKQPTKYITLCSNALYIHSIWSNDELVYWRICRADSRFGPSQWEMAIRCNDVSHWLAASLGSALICVCDTRLRCAAQRFIKFNHSEFRKCSTSCFYIEIELSSC